MNIAASQTLIELFGNVDVFLVVFVRVMGFFIILPVMAGQNMPIYARLGLSLGMALLAFTSGVIELPPYQFTLIGFSFLIMQEFMIGLVIGFVVMMYFSLFHFVGQLVDFQIGFSMVSVADPFGQMQTPITGNFYYLIVSVFFVWSGALHAVIEAFFASFGMLPIGEAHVLGNAALTFFVFEVIIEYFVLALRIAMPVIGTVIIVDIILGILVKAVPQMNVFVVGLPIKVFLGLIVIYLTLPLLQAAFGFVMNDVIATIWNVIGGMMP
ncbi:MAG: flagellar biosynthetic protein FliR [Clostridiales bacterium]|jgi:flagellar biosynthetic protein FliR|nr:flagellar biosynthetic protein FliR [Clostridiales bacterium]